MGMTADFAKFVFNDSDSFSVLLSQYAIEQRGFASAEKSSQNRNGNALVDHATTITATGRSCKLFAIPSKRSLKSPSILEPKIS